MNCPDFGHLLRVKPRVFLVFLGKSNHRRTCVVVDGVFGAIQPSTHVRCRRRAGAGWGGRGAGAAVPGDTPGGAPRIRGQKSDVIILKKAVPRTTHEGVPQRPDIESIDFTTPPFSGEESHGYAAGAAPTRRGRSWGPRSLARKDEHLVGRHAPRLNHAKWDTFGTPFRRVMTQETLVLSKTVRFWAPLSCTSGKSIFQTLGSRCANG